MNRLLKLDIAMSATSRAPSVLHCKELSAQTTRIHSECIYIYKIQKIDKNTYVYWHAILFSGKPRGIITEFCFLRLLLFAIANLCDPEIDTKCFRQGKRNVRK